MTRQNTPKNPFVIEGYVSPDFFCDRKVETALLDRDFITSEEGAYQLCDKFFRQYLTLD